MQLGEFGDPMAGYAPSPGRFDELVDGVGALRAHWEPFVRALGALDSGVRAVRTEQLNVRVREKAELTAVPAVRDAISRVEARVAGQGRLLVRYSGTEPLLRVMLEGRDRDEIHAWAQEIVDVVREHLG